MDMESEARKRKARLAAMRKAAAAATAAAAETPAVKPTEEPAVEKGGNGRKEDMGTETAGTETADGALQDTLEAMVSGVVEATVARRQQEVETQELDIAAIAPKHANWDLKRSLQQRLDGLQAKNQAAVAELISRRIKESAESQ
ncbi:hypothetical protein LPJ56_003884 [Coemansia sp. RSA 2599]|nr:hypothetical protein LPJ56_003884 [Coemansia sp. RSA 2599]